MPNKFDREMQKIFEECQRWLLYPSTQSKFEDALKELRTYLANPTELSSKAFLRLERLGLHSSMAACEAYGRQDLSSLATHLNACVGYRSLVSRLEATFSAMTPKEAGGRPAAFKDSMKAAGPTMLGQWNKARICAKGLIDIAEKDQCLRIPESRRLHHGTVDSFLIGLFSQAFLIKTEFQSLKPMHPVYVTLLKHWNSSNKEEYIAAMRAALEFHISRSRESTDSVSYEFDDYFNRVFPVELLAVQSLRRRDHLPAMEIRHPLVDDAWSTITQLPAVPVDPLLLAIEARLKNDYLLFR